jgi:hypothetical protein
LLTHAFLDEFIEFLPTTSTVHTRQEISIQLVEKAGSCGNLDIFARKDEQVYSAIPVLKQIY